MANAVGPIVKVLAALLVIVLSVSLLISLGMGAEDGKYERACFPSSSGRFVCSLPTYHLGYRLTDCPFNATCVVEGR